MATDLTLFDYAGQGIAADKASRLEFYAARIEAGHQNAMASMMQAAEALSNAREEFRADQDFGRWRTQRLPWLTNNMGAEYLNLWKVYGDQFGSHPGGNRLFLTSATALRMLAQPAAEPIREQVEQRIEAGETITKAEVERLKREAADAKRQAAEATDLLTRHQEISAEKAAAASRREANLTEGKRKAEAEAAAAIVETSLKVQAALAERIAKAEADTKAAREQAAGNPWWSARGSRNATPFSGPALHGGPPGCVRADTGSGPI